MGENSLLPRFCFQVGGFVYGEDYRPLSGLLCGLLKEAIGRTERRIHPARFAVFLAWPRAPQAVVMLCPILRELVILVAGAHVKCFCQANSFKQVWRCSPFVTPSAFVNVHSYHPKYFAIPNPIANAKHIHHRINA